MAEPLIQSVSITLMDADPDHHANLPIRLAGSPHGVSLFAEGYGDKCTMPGYGTPVFVELHKGELRVLVWSDINMEDPTHIIPLGGAREDRRQPDDEQRPEAPPQGDQEMKTVVVTVEGGVVQHVECPEGVKVVVRDYDCEGCDSDLVSVDEDGNEYVGAVWGDDEAE
jgi:hypothetical protein